MSRDFAQRYVEVAEHLPDPICREEAFTMHSAALDVVRDIEVVAERVRDAVEPALGRLAARVIGDSRSTEPNGRERALLAVWRVCDRVRSRGVPVPFSKDEAEAITRLYCALGNNESAEPWRQLARAVRPVGTSSRVGLVRTPRWTLPFTALRLLPVVTVSYFDLVASRAVGTLPRRDGMTSDSIHVEYHEGTVGAEDDALAVILEDDGRVARIARFIQYLESIGCGDVTVALAKRRCDESITDLSSNAVAAILTRDLGRTVSPDQVRQTDLRLVRHAELMDL